MKRLKTLALAVTMTVVLTATVGAAGALASGFVAGQYPASLTAAPTTNHIIKTHGSPSMQCQGPAFSSTLTGPSESVQGSAANSQCQQGLVTAPVKMNSCDLTFTPGAEVGPGTFSGTFAIGPEGCGPVVIDGPCKTTIPAQSGLQATYTNVGSGSGATVTITAQVTGLKHTQGSGCPSPGTFADGTWNGSWSLTGSGGVSVSSTLPNGLYLAGNESGEAAQQPRLEAERYPATLTSETLSSHKFTSNQGSVTCNSAAFSGTLSGSTKAFSVAPEYGKCRGAAEAVVTNGCTYVLNVANAGPPYVGTVDIVCPAGKAIEIPAPGCTISIGSQSGLSGVAYANEGAASTRKVKVTFNVTGISYDECGTQRTNGAYSGVVRLGAVS